LGAEAREIEPEETVYQPDIIVPEIEAIRTERFYDYEKRGIRARYRPEVTPENADRLPKDRAAVEIRIQEFSTQNNLIHLIFGFGPGGKWKSKIAFNYAVYKPGLSEPVKQGSAEGAGLAATDFEEWKQEASASRDV